MKDFSKKLALVPNKPGSYQMKNSDGVIIYVGKAKNLNKRLRSYFNKNVTGKTRALVENIDDFDYIVTSSELESLILEINLIKKYDPKYNILLRDDKSYPYIELTHEKYPMVRVVRNVKRKRLDSNLFGPYPNAGAARRTVEIINRVYPLRKCRNLGKELCLYYHLGECLGYCVKKIDETIINDMVDDIKKFLRGDSSVISDKLKIEMDKASNAMNYEKAKELRDMLDDINTTLKKQKIDLINNKDVDIFNYSFDNNYLSIECFYIRGGVLFGRDNKIINYLGDVREAFLEYITVYYDKRVKPKEVIVPEEYGGEQSARILASDTFLDYFKVDENLCMVEMLPIPKWVGKNMIELNLRKNYKINVIAYMNHKTGHWKTIDPAEPLEADNELLIVLERDQLNRINKQ